MYAMSGHAGGGLGKNAARTTLLLLIARVKELWPLLWSSRAKYNQYNKLIFLQVTRPSHDRQMMFKFMIGYMIA